MKTIKCGRCDQEIQINKTKRERVKRFLTIVLIQVLFITALILAGYIQYQRLEMRLLRGQMVKVSAVESRVNFNQ